MPALFSTGITLDKMRIPVQILKKVRLKLRNSAVSEALFDQVMRVIDDVVLQPIRWFYRNFVFRTITFLQHPSDIALLNEMQELWGMMTHADLLTLYQNNQQQ